MPLPLLKTITLHRQGTIKVRVSGTNHCAAESAVTDEGLTLVKYTVDLVTDGSGLDERGFLVDQERLHTELINIGMEPVAWHEPCELLAVIWGERLMRWVSVENIQCAVHELSLTLSPAPHAGHFTAHFVDKLLAPSIQRGSRVVVL